MFSSSRMRMRLRGYDQRPARPSACRNSSIDGASASVMESVIGSSETTSVMMPQRMLGTSEYAPLLAVFSSKRRPVNS